MILPNGWWRLLVVAAAVAGPGAALIPATVTALSDARMATAAELLLDVRQNRVPAFAGVAQPDRALAGDAWRSGGAHVTAADLAPVSLNLLCFSGSPAADHLAPEPVPADFLLYTGIDGAQRIALFVSPTDVVVYDPGHRRPAQVPLAALQPDFVATADQPRLAGPQSPMQCRLPAAAWPGGIDDRSRGGGVIAIADPASVAAQQQFATAHPRATTEWWRPLAQLGGQALSVVSGVVSNAFTLVVTGAAVILKRFGWPGAAAVAILGFAGAALGSGFDGRRAHRVLTALVLGSLLLVPFAVLAGPGVAARVFQGLLQGRSADDLIRENGGGWILNALVGVASFTVDVITGITDSDHVAVGWVLFAVVSDIAVLPKVVIPLRGLAHAVPFAARLVPEATRAAIAARTAGSLSPLARAVPALHGVGSLMIRTTPRVLDLAGRAGDVVALKPSAIAAAGHAVSRAGRRLPGLPGMLDGSPGFMTWAGRVPHTGMATQIADAASLSWRPESVAHDLIDHMTVAVDALDKRISAPPTGWPVARMLHTYEAQFGALAPGRQRAIVETLHRMTDAVREPAHIVAELAHLQSGAHTTTAVASGQPIPSIPPPAAPPPSGSSMLRVALARARR